LNSPTLLAVADGIGTISGLSRRLRTKVGGRDGALAADTTPVAEGSTAAEADACGAAIGRGSGCAGSGNATGIGGGATAETTGGGGGDGIGETAMAPAGAIDTVSSASRWNVTLRSVAKITITTNSPATRAIIVRRTRGASKRPFSVTAVVDSAALVDRARARWA
jgi:hypothetical protein